MIGIYKIESPTGKIYVGQSWNILRRLKEYKSGGSVNQSILYRSFIKYGWDAHKFEVVMELPEYSTQGVLDTWEEYWMDFYRSQGIKLMNIREAGSRGRHSEETKKKIGIANKLTPKLRGKHHPNFGKKTSEEMKVKIAKANSGRKHSEETKKKMSIAHSGGNNAMFGKTHSEAVKRKMSIAKQGPNHPMFGKVGHMIGKNHSEEVKRKIGLANIGRFDKPVLQFSLDDLLIKEWSSATEASRKLQISNKDISAVCCGRRKTSHGFIWKFKENI